MKNTQLFALIATSVLMASPSIDAAGFKEIRVEDAGQPELAVGVWYPSDEIAPASPNTRFGMALAVDAPVGKTHGGLIVISHGYSGFYAGHADTAAALADAGYIVAAPSHTGNTYTDMSSPAHQWMLDRPRHISKVIDHMLETDALSKTWILRKLVCMDSPPVVIRPWDLLAVCLIWIKRNNTVRNSLRNLCAQKD